MKVKVDSKDDAEFCKVFNSFDVSDQVGYSVFNVIQLNASGH